MIVQGSDAWFQSRLGKVTASRVCDVMARTKSGWGASRAAYAAQLICERLTGQPTETFTNAAMAWGVEKEGEARDLYAHRFGVDVLQVGFVDHPEILAAGASPDGLVGDEGLVEIKAPTTATHLDTLLSETVPGKYITQMQFQMACTGRRWCDFASFDPRLPDELSLFVKRVHRDEALILEMETAVSDFLAEIDATLAKLRERYMAEAA